MKLVILVVDLGLMKSRNLIQSVRVESLIKPLRAKKSDRYNLNEKRKC